MRNHIKQTDLFFLSQSFEPFFLRHPLVSFLAPFLQQWRQQSVYNVRVLDRQKDGAIRKQTGVRQIASFVLCTGEAFQNETCGSDQRKDTVILIYMDSFASFLVLEKMKYDAHHTEI